MSKGKAARAAAAETANDPQKAVLLGSERSFDSTLPETPQASRACDLVAAARRSHSDSALADAMRAAIVQRGRA